METKVNSSAPMSSVFIPPGDGCMSLWRPSETPGVEMMEEPAPY